MHPGPDNTTAPGAATRPAFFAPAPLDGHELIDCGDGWKLERFGDRLIARPDPQALWSRRLDDAAWDRADLVFERDEPSAKGRVPAGIPQGKRGRWRGHFAGCTS